MRICWIAVLSACSFSGGANIPPGDGRDEIDGPISIPPDVMLVPIDGCTTFASQLDTCLGTGPDITWDMYEDYNYDTDDGSLAARDSDGNDVSVPSPGSVIVPSTAGGSIRVILATNFTLGAGQTLTVQGAHVFGIAASGTVTIGGTISAITGTSNGTQVLAAGARTAAACGALAGSNGSNSQNGAGGASGGAFQRAGGGGGDGIGEDGASVPTGLTQAPVGPIGGCPGGDGGEGSETSSGGTGGSGGGAVYIAAAVKIEVSALGGINVAGRGGSGGDGRNNDGGSGYQAGGGGGGSGGMIWLECGVIDIAGRLTANGGGGGEGSGTDSPGDVGNIGRNDLTRTAGGSGQDARGGDGGAGDAGGSSTGGSVGLKGTSGGGGGDSGGGGGGGGGGVGYVVLSPNANISTVTISPPISTIP